MSLQKRLKCFVASGCWVSALLSWESMRFMQEGRGDFAASTGLMLPVNAIHGLGAAGEKIPEHCSFCKHFTAMLGNKNCFILLHLASLQVQLSLFF